MAKTTGKTQMTVKTEKTVETSKTVDILDMEIADCQEAQRMNSIYMEFDEHPTNVAITGCAIWKKLFAKGEDMVLGLKVLPQGGEQEKIIQIRAFKKLQANGKIAPSSFAYRQAAEILKAAGAVITSVGDNMTKPNLRDFRWVATNATVVTVGTREYEGRYFPNSVRIYKPLPTTAPTSGNFLDEVE